MSFGEKLSKLRKERGLSQEELAQDLNVSRQAVSKWESNSSYPETEKIIAICKIFNCSMDEIIGIKETKEEKNKILNIINKYFDLIVKAIKLFFNMTFKQKIKCILEMAFYSVFVIIVFFFLDIVLVEILRRLLYLLPNEILIILLQTFKGILYLIYLILGVFILIKFYKIRYLEYYDTYYNNKDSNEIVLEESKKHNINIKEEKIIIRDPNNAFKPFSWIKKGIMYFTKFSSFIIVLTLAISFVILLACIIFVLYFANMGLSIVYVAIGLIGMLIGIYVILEMLIKFIFNVAHSFKKLFVMFIIAMLIVGISSGLFACELLTYKIIDKPIYDTLIHEEEIEVQDNLLMYSLYYDNADVIFEERENIKLEFYATKQNIARIETSNNGILCKNSTGSINKYYERYVYYNYNDYFNGETFNTFLRNILKMVKQKEIVSEEVLFNVKTKIYISEENYQKILNIQKEYEKNNRHSWCTYE